MDKSRPSNPAPSSRDDPAFEKAWRSRFIEFAELSDDDAGIAGWSSSGLQTRMRQFVAVWPGLHEGSLWLDAGCGAGTYARLLGAEGARVVAADYSPLAIAKARARDDSGCEWLVADVNRLPFRAGQFDGILCFGVTQALSDSMAAVQELAGRAKPGAEVWIDGLNAWCAVNVWEQCWRRIRGRPKHLRYEYPGALRQAIASAGLREEQFHWMPILPARMQRLQRIVETRWCRALLASVPGLGAFLSHSFMIRARKTGGR